jgi:hypothetical protein
VAVRATVRVKHGTVREKTGGLMGGLEGMGGLGGLEGQWRTRSVRPTSG